MTNKEALEKIIFDYKFKEKVESGYVYHTEIPFMEAIANIKRDLEILEILKKHLCINSWGEIAYDTKHQYQDINEKCELFKPNEEDTKIKEWLNNESL